MFESDYTDYPSYNTPLGTPAKGESIRPCGSRKAGASVKKGESYRMDASPHPRLLFKDDQLF